MGFLEKLWFEMPKAEQQAETLASADQPRLATEITEPPAFNGTLGAVFIGAHLDGDVIDETRDVDNHPDD